MYFITDMKRTRTNMEAPTERVFDSTDVLTTEQEQELREYTALGEQIAKCDIVLETINRPVEGPEIANMGYRYDDWELNGDIIVYYPVLDIALELLEILGNKREQSFRGIGNERAIGASGRAEGYGNIHTAVLR